MPIDGGSERIDVSLRDIEEARSIASEVAIRTPAVSLQDETGSEVRLKLENLQRLGSFKIRGTWNRLRTMSESDRRRGVATVSSGNHGLSLAWAARRLEIPSRVLVPEGAVPRKVEAIRSLGADVASMPRADLVRLHEDELWRTWRETFVHPFAHPATIAGAGTAGLELAEDAPDVRTVLVPVGGGGLASGIAIAVKGKLPRARVYGVQAEGAAALPTALRTAEGHRILEPRTIADGIKVGVILPAMARILSRQLDGCLLVSDDDIRTAMRRLALEAKVVAEPAGAAAFAAWIRHRASLASPVAAIVSGGNADPSLVADVLR